jgi:hypothetical protein
MTRFLIPIILAALAGCGASPTAGPRPDAGTGFDGGLTGPYDLPGIAWAVAPGAPITAAEGTWTFVPVEGARCGNGTQTGMAVNLSGASEQVLIFLAGGGACWEAAACAAGTATHINDTLGEGPVLAEAQHQNLAVIFDRDDPSNPFRDASFVYIPYCTGDLHGGTQVTTYDWFGPRQVHHVGARNMDAYLSRLQPTFPAARRVVLSGISAGGFGATFHWWRVQKAFPWAPVDVLNDSGLLVDVAPDGRYGTMKQRWAPEFPPGCTDCPDRLSAALTHSASLLGAPRRYAMLGYLRDGTIGLFFGLQGHTVEAQLLAARAAAAPNVKTFYLNGSDHVVLTTPNVSPSGGMSARAWVTLFADPTAAPEHHGP